MKIEIDIDEDYYKIICKRVEKNKPYHSPYEYEVIADGKPIEQEPTTKNDLGVDCISRQALLNTTVKKNSIWNKITDSEGNNLETIISNLPSVTPQEPTDKNFTKADIDAIVKAINAHWELIIDEIRAEIKGMTPTYHNPDWSITDLVPISEVLKLVDKYKAESEGKE